MTVERIHPKAPVMLIFIAIFTCLPSCINLSNINSSGPSIEPSACHRNSNRPKSVTNDLTGKTTNIPPSVTVRFYDSYKKDTILHKYRNYEHNKPKKVRVYQSLNNYYTNLKKKITSF